MAPFDTEGISEVRFREILREEIQPLRDKTEELRTNVNGLVDIVSAVQKRNNDIVAILQDKRFIVDMETDSVAISQPNREETGND